MPSSDILRQVTAWSSTGIKATWTVSEVRSALQQHADGNFSQSALLCDSFGEDDVMPGVLEKRVDAVLGSEFELNPVEEPNKQLSARIVSRFGALWWDMFPESELAELLSWYCMLGVAVGVLDWERGGSRWTARLRVLHPQHLRWDSFRRVWIYSAQEGELVVTPGDGKWVLLTDGQRGYMRAAVRALAITWIAKQLTIRDWNRYNERHGLPIIKAFAPAIADDEDQEQFWADVKAIQSETVAQLPTDLGDKGARFDLELLEAKDGSWQSFKEMLDRCDRRIMVHILGSNLSTEVSGAGSLAATKVHRGVEISKATAGATKLSTELRQQALFPVVSYNLSGVTTVDVIPWPRWDTAPPEDDAANAAAVETFARGLVQIGLAGYEVKNLDAVAERYGLELQLKPKPVLALPLVVPPVAPIDDSQDTDAPTAFRPFAAARDADFDSALFDAIAASSRTVIAGGPRSGKTTLAVRASERFGREARHSDGLMNQHDWEASAGEVAKWLDDGDNWIAEGVATPRGMRQWLTDNPGKALDATIILLSEPRLPLSQGQATMATGVRTVWDEIAPDLKSRGANVIEV